MEPPSVEQSASLLHRPYLYSGGAPAIELEVSSGQYDSGRDLNDRVREAAAGPAGAGDRAAPAVRAAALPAGGQHSPRGGIIS
jgi:hypothetical protein